MSVKDNLPSTSADSQQPVDTPLTRESLYKLVWSEPMLKVAERFGVSSSYMARVCSRMNVPRPQRGYWAKLAVGKKPKQPPLPDAQPGDELAWSRNGDEVWISKPLPKAPVRLARRRVVVPPSVQDQHLLIKGARALFETGRLSGDAGYSKPAKRLLVDLVVTKNGLDKALSFANQLFLSLEANGHRVVIAPHAEQFRRADVDELEQAQRNRGYHNLWSPGRSTVVYFGTVAIGLTIIEMSEVVEVRYVNGEYVREADYVPPKRTRYASDFTWTTKKAFPTGRLRLQAYCPYRTAKWEKLWQETKDSDLISAIPKIVKELGQSAIEIARLVEEGERQAELEHQRWEAQRAQWQREESERRAAKALQDSKAELLQIINEWSEVMRIEQFFSDVERRSQVLDAESRQQVVERLARARQLIGGSDSVEKLKHWKMPEEH